MAATEVQKPDHAAPRRHFIFTEEHEALRESIHAFVMKEWRRTRRSGRRRPSRTRSCRGWASSGFLGLSMPEKYGGQGGDYYANLVLAEELSFAGSAGCRWVSRSTPTWPRRRFCSSAPRSRSRRYLVPAIQGEKIACLGITEPDAGLRRLGHPHSRGPRRRRVRHQRLQDLHHQRPPRRLHRAGHQDRPRRGLRRLLALRRRHGPAGGGPREALEKLGMHASDTALLAFQDVRVPERRCWASSARASTTSCGSSRASD